MLLCCFVGDNVSGLILWVCDSIKLFWVVCCSIQSCGFVKGVQIPIQCVCAFGYVGIQWFASLLFVQYEECEVFGGFDMDLLHACMGGHTRDPVSHSSNRLVILQVWMLPRSIGHEDCVGELLAVVFHCVNKQLVFKRAFVLIFSFLGVCWIYPNINTWQTNTNIVKSWYIMINIKYKSQVQ